MKNPERVTLLPPVSTPFSSPALRMAALGAALIAGTVGGSAALAAGGGGFTQVGPKASHVEPIAGTDIKRVTLTLKAAQRLDIRTGQISEKDGVKSAPYSAVIYDKVGKTFVYTNPKPLTYIRRPITIKKYNGDTVILTDGPKVGTVVATRGVLELFGTEMGL